MKIKTKITRKPGKYHGVVIELHSKTREEIDSYQLTDSIEHFGYYDFTNVNTKDVFPNWLTEGQVSMYINDGVYKIISHEIENSW